MTGKKENRSSRAEKRREENKIKEKRREEEKREEKRRKEKKRGKCSGRRENKLRNFYHFLFFHVFHPNV